MAQRERGDEQPAKPVPTAGTDHEIHLRSRGEASVDQRDRTDLLRRVAIAEAEQAEGRAREAALAARLIDAESDLARLLAAERRRTERAERILGDVKSSASWRLTRAVRTAKAVFSSGAR